MKSEHEAILLRIFISEEDHIGRTPLYEAIVLKARKLRLSGATVLRGIMGFGASSHIHTSKILRLSEDLPVVVEIVDKKANIEKIIPWLDENIENGLVTTEKVDIIKYSAKENSREK